MASAGLSHKSKKLKEIFRNIEEIGFENTVLIFSEAETRKNSGKIGWINELSLSKQYYHKNLKLLKKTSDAGGKLQILLSYADLMEISKKEKLFDEFEKLSDVLIKEIKQFGEIKSITFKNMILESFKPIKKGNN